MLEKTVMKSLLILRLLLQKKLNWKHGVEKIPVLLGSYLVKEHTERRNCG